MRQLLAAGVLAVALSATVRADDRILRVEMVVPAPVADVWRAWTTEEGVRTFFAPGARVEPRVDGAYDILFFPNRPQGQRGAEGMRVLGFEPMRRFAFTWNAPPQFPEARGQRTEVVLEFETVGERATRLRFTHQGWGHGGEWDSAYAYFDNAWRAVVLPRLKQRFEKGPIDWSALPELAPIAPSIAVTLVPKDS